MRKTRFSKRTRQKASRTRKQVRGQRGGDLSENTIKKCKSFHRPLNTLIPKFDWSSLCTTKFKSLNQLQEILNTIGSTDILVIKLGSNDAHLGLHKGNFYSGRMDKHYLEKTIPVDRPVHLIAMSPLEKYNGFEYPLNENTIPNNEKRRRFQHIDPNAGFITPYENVQEYYATLKERLISKHYIVDFFPVNINAKGCPENHEFLELLVNWQGPLFIINGMSTPCYQSIKYIIDIRTEHGKQTGYSVFSKNPNRACYFDFPLFGTTNSCKELNEIVTLFDSIVYRNPPLLSIGEKHKRMYGTRSGVSQMDDDSNEIGIDFVKSYFKKIIQDYKIDTKAKLKQKISPFLTKPEFISKLDAFVEIPYKLGILSDV